jgi:dTDP-4-amino-4,6-dideoxygalactose transaminase
MQTTTRIPVLDLAPETETLWDELTAAVHGVIRSGHFIMGPNVKALEGELAEYLGVRHAVALNSGTDALVIGLRALGIGPGDEVVTTPFTFFATAEAISMVGATPVFVDIEPDTLNLDVAQVEARITPRTRALIPVHLFGHSCDMDALMALAEQHGLKVLEDVAQAFGGEHRGRKLGTIGAAGAYSFFPSKNLGCYGDGGLLATNDDQVAELAAMLRTHGSKRKYYNEEIGYNSRLDEMQAAILRVKLPHLDAYNEGRRGVADRYRTLLGDVPGITLPVEHAYARHVYHQYTIRVAGGRRDAVQQRLADAGIATMVYYPVPVHRLPVYAGLGYELPTCQAAADEVLSLPIWPQMDAATAETVADALKACALG